MNPTREHTELLLANAAAWLVELLYLVSPLDLVPDFIPLLGQVDDLLGLGVVVALSTWTWKKLRAEPQEPDRPALVERGGVEAAGWETYQPMSAEDLRTL